MYRIWLEISLPPAYAAMLDGVAEVVGPSTPPAAQSGAQAILAGSSVLYNGELMDQIPTLEVISRIGIGLDNVSIPDATARHILVCYAPDAPTISTAEHALGLLFIVTKNLRQADLSSRNGTSATFFSNYMGMELRGKRLGLVGMGRIGGYVAKVALALGMNVAGYDPFVGAARAAELGIEYAPTLEALLSNADVVSLHIPNNAETRHTMNAERFAQMKRGAILINTARGGLVDEDALIAALDSGYLAGAGLDVLQKEPPDPNHPLMSRDNVFITPHMASTTAAGHRRLWETAIAQALQVSRGERPPNIVNPEVWDVRRKSTG